MKTLDSILKVLGPIVNLLAWIFVIIALYDKDWEQGTFWLAWLIYSSVNDDDECDCEKEKAP